jgi:Tol biopolymer transport system component
MIKALHTRSALSLILAAIGVSCSGPAGYRMISRSEITTVKTKRGSEVRLTKTRYLAFHEDIENSPNVKLCSKVTSFVGKREPGYFTVSPDGALLVYQALEIQKNVPMSNLWRISTKGTGGTTRLTNGNYFDTDPSFSMTGADVYFASNRSSRSSKIYRVQTGGAGGIALLTQGNAVDRWPAPASGDKEVYFTSRPASASDNQIWRIGTTGSLPTQLKEGWQPKVSPDGTKVLYSMADAETKKTKIWVMNTDGTNPTQLSSDPDIDERDPSWSPDGSQIVYSSDAGIDSNGKQNFDIWLMDTNGTQRKQLTTNGSTDLTPAFSADGYIYFLSNRAFNWEIWRFQVTNE